MTTRDLINTYKNIIANEKCTLNECISFLGTINELEREDSPLNVLLNNNRTIDLDHALSYLNDYFCKHNVNAIEKCLDYGVFTYDDIANYKDKRYSGNMDNLINDEIINDDDIRDYIKDNFDAYDMVRIDWD